MADRRLEGAVIVSATQAPYMRTSRLTSLELISQVISDVIKESGLEPGQIDGLAINSFRLPPDNVVTVAEHLGLTLRWAWQGAHGGAGGVISVFEAAQAITHGRANTVVCATADVFDVGSHMAMIQTFNSAMRDYLGIYGFGGTNGVFALVERAHRERYGTTREQLGKLAVTQRRHAQLNSNALLRDPLTLEDYLTARLIADPIRLYDCVMPCSGADAVLLTSREEASPEDRDCVAILAGEQRHNHAPTSIPSLTTGAAEFAENLFVSAGITHGDLDFVQLYDDYPIMELIQLEDLGFAKKGEGGSFVDQHDFSLTGDLPLNTGGGQLSCGQAGASGGMIGVVEAVLQLQKRATGRGLGRARRGLVSGFGMVGYGKGLSSGAIILEKLDQS